MLPVQFEVLKNAGQFQQYAAVTLKFDVRAMQYGGLVLAQGQPQQAGSRCTQGAIGIGGPVSGQQQAFVTGQNEDFQGRVAAIDGNDMAGQTRQARQRCAVQAQHPIDTVLDAGEQPPKQHQGLIPRCRATTPAVML